MKILCQYDETIECVGTQRLGLPLDCKSFCSIVNVLKRDHSRVNRTPKVSLIISNYNGKEMLRECLRSLEEQNYPNYEIIVVDAGSTDGAPKMVSAEFPHVKLLKEKKIGIGEAINKGIIASKGDIIAFDLNNDEIFSKDWLTTLIKELLFSKENKVVSGVRVVLGRDIIDSAGGMIKYNGDGFDLSYKKIEDLPKSTLEVTYVGTPVFRKELLNVIGLLDEKYYIWCEDWDFCEKAKRAGCKVVTVTTAISYHRRSETLKLMGGAMNHYYSRRNTLRLFIKHYPFARMIVAVTIWFGYAVKGVIVFFPPFRRILSLMSIKLTPMSSRESSEYLLTLLGAISWNMKNLSDTLKARESVQSIKPLDGSRC